MSGAFGDDVRLAGEAIWKVLLASIVLGAGLPAVFALGIRSLAWGTGGAARSADGSGTARIAATGTGNPAGKVIAAILFLVILASMKVSFWISFLAATTLITGAAYTLWMIKRVVYGEVANEKVAKLKDVGGRELAFLVILAAAVLALGIYPKPLSDVANPTIQKLLQHVEQTKLQ